MTGATVPANLVVPRMKNVPESLVTPSQGSNVPEGMVLGIDVGYSTTKRTTCFCTLKWDHGTARFEFRLTTADQGQRRDALAALVGATSLAGVALDGPLTRGFKLVRNYRAAEAILSRGILQKRGKPGQTSSPGGQDLHRHASQLAEMVQQHTMVARATHAESISERRIVEAFPSLYLAALVEESQLPVVKRRKASDSYWNVLATESSELARHIERLLPGRVLQPALPSITNHDRRAGVVCALTALSMVVGEYLAVGDSSDGDIILPGENHWGMGQTSDAWLEPILRANLASLAREGHAAPGRGNARARNSSGQW